jgi:hypothetical protein
MRRTSDPFELIRLANPIPDPDRMPDEPDMASTEALVEEIIGMTNTGSRTRTRTKRLRRTLLATATIVVVGASVAIGGSFQGTMEPAEFSGDGWQLIVGQAPNPKGPEPDPATAENWKVCHSWAPGAGTATDANGFGPSGCVTWPDDATETIIMDSVWFETPDGKPLVFVDLTSEDFDTVSAVFDNGSTVDVAPFVMPTTQKKFAVVEVPAGASSADVRILDDGTLLESRTVAGASSG